MRHSGTSRSGARFHATYSLQQDFQHYQLLPKKVENKKSIIFLCVGLYDITACVQDDPDATKLLIRLNEYTSLQARLGTSYKTRNEKGNERRNFVARGRILTLSDSTLTRLLLIV